MSEYSPESKNPKYKKRICAWHKMLMLSTYWLALLFWMPQFFPLVLFDWHRLDTVHLHISSVSSFCWRFWQFLTFWSLKWTTLIMKIGNWWPFGEWSFELINIFLIREHFHCLDCHPRVFVKKEEMIRHFKWHKKRDESLQHGFMRYSPGDDCNDRYRGCPHNRKQTHYHCVKVCIFPFIFNIVLIIYYRSNVKMISIIIPSTG